VALADPASVVERVPERLLAVLEDAHAEKTRGGRRAPRVEGALSGVHLVGGAVRDLLLGREPAEWDLVAEAEGRAVADEIRRRLGGYDRVHERFGTASVETRDGLRIDVATARAEDYPAPGALPVVRAGSLADDMARRDFTVNAIAVGLSPDRRGLVHRADDALEDLEAGRLRVLHDRSFLDDPTRLLRLVRYAARLGFVVEPHTLALAREAIAADAPRTAGVARMGNELMKLLREEPPVAIAALAFLRDLGLHSELDIDEARLARAVALLPEGARRDLVLLGALAHRIERKQLRSWLAGMHLPAGDAGIVDHAARDPEGLAAAMHAAQRPSELHAALARRPDEAVAVAGAFGAEEAARRWFGGVRDVRLEITGDDLLEAGVRQGREIGRRLDAALVHKLDVGAATREDELRAALASEP
jgi:tRNA nucleotidyltransferase (CCA-adding enzyme)